MAGLKLQRMPERLAIVRLPSGTPVPEWLDLSAPFVSVTCTRDEVSIICSNEAVPTDIPANVLVQRPFACFVVVGPLAFDVVGVLAKLSGALANAGISLFTVSTYDTDYILVAEVDADRAANALEAVADLR